MRMLLGLGLLVFPSVVTADDVLKLKPNDRIAMLGGTFIEREQKYGHIEAALTLKHRNDGIVFRNLGWSGDTVYGDARAGFDNSAKGYERLVALTREVKPTFIVLCYGLNESFDGEAGLDRFRKAYVKLLDDLQTTKARIVLMTPTPLENSPGAKPAAERNAMLAKYCGVVRTLALERKVPVVDLYEEFTVQLSPIPTTENGIHLSEAGYQRIAGLLASVKAVAAVTPQLLAMVRAKNELFFHRWRPQNETYLFGFRKHEQGKNAAEIVQFDPLIAAAEADIAKYLKALPAAK